MCFDLAQSNSEHSRHWFFKGRLIVGGQEMEDSLMKMVMKTQKTSNNNSVIKFSDNSRYVVEQPYCKSSIKPPCLLTPPPPPSL